MADYEAPSSIVERILGTASTRRAPSDSDPEAKSFEEMRMPRSRGREALMLDVRRASGQCHGMPYAYLTRIDFDPGDMLKLHFAGDVVQVGGRRLKDLYLRLLEHRVEAIQEGTEAEEGLKPDEAAHIDRIELFTSTEARHDEDRI